MTLFETVKTIIFLTIFAYVAPFFFEGIKKNYLPLLEPRTYIGVIHIQEAIENSYHVTATLHSFFKDSSIKAIVIKMDCSDGAVGTSQTIFHEIRQLKKEYPKPIITLVENKCTGGAYLVASACDYIIAPESAVIGNIGLSESSDTPTIEEKTKNITADIYQQITKQVALARKLSLTTVSNWAEGKIFTGHQALNLGLINEIGSLCNVIKIIKEKALIEGEIEYLL